MTRRSAALPCSLRFLPLAGLIALLATGCATPQPGALPAVRLTLQCPTDARAPNAVYVGPYRGVENVLTVQDQAQDVHCSDAFLAARYPRGFVTVYGSSRIHERNARCTAPGCDTSVAEANDQLHADVRAFARLWTARHGRTLPVMTGAGPGLMEAGNRGAMEAGGPSVGYTTYYDPTDQGTPTAPYGGNPAKALNGFVSEGLIFSSVAVRESAMIRHSTAIVIAPGGTGTEWEIFQIFETLKSRQLQGVPVYLFGDRSVHWASLDQRLADMVRRGTIRAEELAFVQHVSSPQELVDRLGRDLALP